MRIFSCLVLGLLAIAGANSSPGLDESKDAGHRQSSSRPDREVAFSVKHSRKAGLDDITQQQKPPEATHARSKSKEFGKRDIPPRLQRRDRRPRAQQEADEAARHRAQRERHARCLRGVAAVGCGLAAAGAYAAWDRFLTPGLTAERHAAHAPHLAVQRVDAAHLGHQMRALGAAGTPLPPDVRARAAHVMRTKNVDAGHTRLVQAETAAWLRASVGRPARDALRRYRDDLAATTRAHGELRAAHTQLLAAQDQRPLHAQPQETKERVAQVQKQLRGWNGGQSGIPQPEKATHAHDKDARVGAENGEHGQRGKKVVKPGEL